VFVPEDGTIRPVQRGTVPRSVVVYPNQTNSRFTTHITVLILLATLSLLGFSIYLPTVQLHLFTLPFINGQSTPTPAPSLIEVPNLNHMNWAEALKTANDAGFQLRPQPSSGTDGIVVKQSPPYPSKARGGTFIEVQMEVQKATIPNIPPGTTLGSYEALFQSLGFNKYNVASDGQPPKLSPNTVTKVSPSPGSSVAVDSPITIYLNDLNGSPAVTPTPSPTAKLSPTPTAKPSLCPSPSPSQTPSPSSSPTPTPK
jgi:beta-lactam-binding protein with PASTA domain